MPSIRKSFNSLARKLSRRGVDQNGAAAASYAHNASCQTPSLVPEVTHASPISRVQQLPLEQSESFAQPVLSSASSPTAAPTSENDTCRDPWPQAYEMVRGREPDLMTDYSRHLATGHDATGLLSTPQSVESVVKRLLHDREMKQWRVSLFGRDVKVRKQAEKLAKFLLWSDDIVKSAVSAQPYAALAWSAVSVLLPVRHRCLTTGIY